MNSDGKKKKKRGEREDEILETKSNYLFTSFFSPDNIQFTG